MSYDDLIDKGLYEQEQLIKQIESLSDDDLITVYNWLIGELKKRNILDR